MTGRVRVRQVSADIGGNLTFKCVGTLITWPYTSGGRSRRGSPKAGHNDHADGHYYSEN